MYIISRWWTYYDPTRNRPVTDLHPRLPITHPDSETIYDWIEAIREYFIITYDAHNGSTGNTFHA